MTQFPDLPATLPGAVFEPPPHLVRGQVPGPLERRAMRLGLALCWLALALALLVLGAGWLAGMEILVRLRPIYPAMVPETALGVALTATGTIALYRHAAGWIVPACAALTVLTVPLGHADLWALRSAHPGDAMSLATSIALLLAAGGLIQHWLALRGRKHFGVTLASIGLFVTAVPLLGYVFAAPDLFRNPIYTAMALHTALCLFALFLARLLAIPERGWIATLLAPEGGGRMSRRFLPMLIAAPLLLSALALLATRLDLLSPDFRLAALALAMIVFGVVGLLYLAHSANLSERRTQMVESLLRESERARQRTELAAMRAQKTESLGQLVGGVAHDFNNTLTVILGNLELLQSAGTYGAAGAIPDAAPEDFITDAIAAANHAAALTSQLLAYGRKSRLAPELRDVAPLVQETLGMFTRVCPPGIAVDIRQTPEPCTIEVDPSGFRQALLNILINARDAMPGGGRITVTSRIKPAGGSSVQGFGAQETLAPGTYLCLAICDEGPGIPHDIRARATEPFFTTKPVGEGTGLGLSMVAGFCRQSNGGLRISEASGGGACLTMIFPCAGTLDPPAPDIAAGARAESAGGILVVDDDPKVSRIVRRQLEQAGHDVRCVGSPAEALELLARGPLPALVITDIVMPGPLQGHALAAEIRKRHPGIALLLMSGYESAANRRLIEGTDDIGFLQKPIQQGTLRRAVDKALAERADRQARG